MARKSNRVLIGLQCKICNRQNYTTSKNKMNTTEKVVMTKFCKGCSSQTEHKEKQKLK